MDLATFPIETERLWIRPYCPGDEAEIVEFVVENRIRLQGLMTEWASGVQNVDDAQRFIRQSRAAWMLRRIFLFGVWTKPARELAGEIMLFNVREQESSIELGYYVSRRFEGQGLATEAARACIVLAFSSLGVSTIRARCSRDNDRSRNTARRCGFLVVNEGIDGVHYELTSRDDSLACGSPL